ncbi:S-layer homology domain-containing protein [Cohnella yongneupensis]|uniref:S-layer homology domain-containing protein n=1 Tax=Cohnella yongneupensis TaxID=425006 RepID=A0ABW0QWW1_9BACL
MTHAPSIMKKTAVALLATSMLAGSAVGIASAHSKNEDSHGKGKDKSSSHKIELNFKDLNDKQWKWAYEHIIRLASQGVFNGYEDGSFKPQAKITRIEALVAAVRLLGLQAEAEKPENMNAKLNFKDFDKMKSKYGWAVGYVTVALENDLFSENDISINPEQPATRLWASVLLVKAMKLEADAKAKMGTELPFRDARDIPAGSVGYVAVALEKNLITGYEVPASKWSDDDNHRSGHHSDKEDGDDNDQEGSESVAYNRIFMPNKPVTRAELAALLDRVDEQLPEEQNAMAITGVVQSVVNGIVTVKKADGKSVAVTAAPNVFIFRNDVKAPISSIVAGDEVLLRTFEGKAVFIEVTKVAAASIQFTDLGKLTNFTLNNQAKIATVTVTKQVNGVDQSVTYNVDSNVTITGGNGVLAINSVIVVKGDTSIVKAIEIQN